MSVRVRVHQAGIQSMFVPGGDINGFGRRVAFTTSTNMRKFALNRMRTGRLAKSFRTTSQVRHNRVRFNVQSSEKHALYLHAGTRPRAGNITLYAGVLSGRQPRSAAFPRWQRYIGARVYSVRGTRPTYFMSRALNQSLRRHQLV